MTSGYCSDSASQIVPSIGFMNILNKTRQMESIGRPFDRQNLMIT